MQKEIIAAYAAGIFDGEGYVGLDKISRSTGSLTFNIGVRVIISQKDGLLMHWLKNNFGGNVYSQRNGTKYSIYRWRIHSKKAVNFLKTIQPYVVIKKLQVDFAILFDKEKDERWIKNGRAGKNGKFLKTTNQEVSYRESQKEKLTKIKKVYTLYEG